MGPNINDPGGEPQTMYCIGTGTGIGIGKGKGIGIGIGTDKGIGI